MLGLLNSAMLNTKKVYLKPSQIEMSQHRLDEHIIN